MIHKAIFTLSIVGIRLYPAKAENQIQEKNMTRIEICKQNYARLFGGEALDGKGSDPESINILQKYINQKVQPNSRPEPPRNRGLFARR